MKCVMKTIKMTDSQDVPTLLLGYTYFLNNKHNSYINIGFDSETLNQRIILFKNQQYLDLSQAEWQALITYRCQISDFFYNNTASEIAPENKSHVTWKLSRRKEGRVLLAVDVTNKRITISSEEWMQLNAFLNFLNSVNVWAIDFQRHLKSYYSEYLRKCIKEGMLHLPTEKFFMICSYNITCNYSRLFAELPVISATKLASDFHVASNIDAAV